MSIQIKILDDPNLLTKTAAAEIADLIAQILQKKDRVRLVLTGGTLGIQILEDFALLGLPLESLDVFWGDERFVDLFDKDRNEQQALIAWPELSNARLFRFPFPDMTLEAAAAAMCRVFETELGSLDSEGAIFDVLILGMGPDGHVASLFPGHSQEKSWIIAEPASPKPPSLRLSFSYEALNRASHVVILASGESKASAVACALQDETCDLPVARVSGLESTTWYLDTELSLGL